MKLPEKFIDEMKDLLKEDYDNYIACLDNPMYHALRVNTLKISVEDFLKISPFELTPVPWCKNAFYYDDAICKPSKHPYYYAGLYYLQEPSATLPATTLPIEEGDIVLDICAAPGGKSTELAAKLKGTGFLVSNDISASRAKALLKNLEVFGVDNMMICCEAPNTLSKAFPEGFDKILIDAPCSGEGMFRKSYSMVTAWEQNGTEMFAGIQRGILNEVVKMLKPGGMILYSTCTFSQLEDEKSVEYLLDLDENLEIVPFEMAEGFVCGKPEYTESKDESYKYCARLFPHKIKGEGHFTVLLKDKREKEDGIKNDYFIKPSKLPEELKDFLSNINKDMPSRRFEIKKEKVYFIKEACPDTEGLRILRQGLLFGEIKKNRFEPSEALAMSLKKEEFRLTLNLSREDERVLRYLKGETIDITETEATIEEGFKDKKKEGYILILVDSFPLGFGKLKNGTIKNKYLPGWRMM